MNSQHAWSLLLCCLLLTACTSTAVPPAAPAESAPPVTAVVTLPSAPVVVTPAPRLQVPATTTLPVSPLPAEPTPTAVSGLLASVQQAVAAGELERGAALSERALRISPRDAQLWYQLALIRFRQQRLDEAGNTARRALALVGLDGKLKQQIEDLLRLITP